MAKKDMMTQGVIPSKEGGLVLALVFKQVTISAHVKCFKIYC